MSKWFVYHITHIRNLPSIIESGLLSDTLATGYTCIGDQDIKAARKNKSVPKRGEAAEDFKVVADYVPFYYAPRSPMLYTINRNNVVGYQEGQIPIIYLACHIKTLWDKYTCCASSHNAACNLAIFLHTVQDIEAGVDLELMKARFWNGTEDDPDRMQRRMAEFLVLDKVNFVDVAGIGTISEQMKNEVGKILHSFSLKTTVEVMPDWYY